MLRAMVKGQAQRSKDLPTLCQNTCGKFPAFDHSAAVVSQTMEKEASADTALAWSWLSGYMADNQVPLS